MQNHPGVFIVIEGADGSGKSTQFRLSVERLRAVGHDVQIFKFPQYGEPSSFFIKAYLNGDYGPANDISPYTASLFYALDRYHASSKIRAALKEGKVVVADRYVGSNMAHQGSKFTALAQQRGFFIWEDSLEFELLGIPRPDINLYLRVPLEISTKLMGGRSKRGYTDKKLDQHEADTQHLQKTIATYDLLCKLFPKDFKEIDCVEDGQLLDIVKINDHIWQTIKPLLPEPKHKGKGAVIILGQSAGDPKTRAKVKQSKSDSKQITPDKDKLNQILDLQEQMLAKAGSIKGVNQQQLKTAIELTTPLRDYKNQIGGLIKQEAAPRKAAETEPASLNKLIGQLTKSMPAPTDGEQLKLVQAKPSNEFQLLTEASITGLNYQQKQQLLKDKLRKDLSKLVYTFEAISDFKTLLALRKTVNTKELQLLTASPLLGYNTPEIIESAILEESFNKAFEISSDAYHQAASKGDAGAIYNLLLGHSVRYKLTVDGASLSKALKTIKDQSLVAFLGQLVDKIGEIHPNVAKILSNKEPSGSHKNIKKNR